MLFTRLFKKTNVNDACKLQLQMLLRLNGHFMNSHGSTRNMKTTASTASFSAILSCEILDFGSLCVLLRARQLNC